MTEEEQKAAEQEATQKPEQSPRGLAALRGRYSEKEPEGGWGEASDDDLVDRYMKDSDDTASKMKEYEETDAKMSELFKKDKQSASFLMGMARGEDFLSNLQRNYGADIVEAMNDPEKLEALKKANEEYQQKVAQNKQLHEDWTSNMEQSLLTIAKAQEELNLGDEEVDEAMDKLKEVVDAYNSGKIDMDIVKLFMNAINHDRDVDTAAKEAEIKGRNANITEQMRRRKAEEPAAGSLGGQSNRGAEGRRINQRTGRGGLGSGIWAEGGFKKNVYQ